ncbi:MAG: hypothetical protein BWZ05_02266 [Bacteroidetes bacterium ADurb.BinA245]|nr:MAG: hypothetical protein BWZ05_02266 [Bacteroidetes bacterium ADurb.BinA245]
MSCILSVRSKKQGSCDIPHGGRKKLPEVFVIIVAESLNHLSLPWTMWCLSQEVGTPKKLILLRVVKNVIQKKDHVCQLNGVNTSKI